MATIMIINAETPKNAETEVLSFIQEGFVAKSARIKYNLKGRNSSPEKLEDYPLILEGFFSNYHLTMHVYPLTVGYNGLGTREMANILKAAGFKFKENEILTNYAANEGHQICLTYEK